MDEPDDAVAKERENASRRLLTALQLHHSSVVAEPTPLADPVPEEPAPPPESIEQWVERQKKIHKPWFSIVEEIEHPAPKPVRIEDIHRAVCKFYGVARDDFLSARRTMNLVMPRQVAMYLCKTMTGKSLPEIGRRFGGRDHTTVLHGTRKISRLIESDENLARDVQTLAASVGGSIA